jgi:adenine-specific DNA-methyltransferase
MGTKRRLSPQIKKIVEGCQTGPFLDAFAGMCAVGTQIAPSRQVWANDLQAFSNTVSTALFQSWDWPPDEETVRSKLLEPFSSNMMELARNHGAELHKEAKALSGSDHVTLRSVFEDALERNEFPESPKDGFQDLFTQRYGGVYFSVGQCIEIDSVRFGADFLLNSGQITIDQHRWLLIALAVALNRCTTSPGHFAQPLAPKPSNFSRLTKQRSRSILSEVLRALPELRPLGSRKWRRKNKIFRESAGDLLSRLGNINDAPSVVYADPPYTDDQYSRYYHLYETLILYDYPTCLGRGRYRSERAVSDFSLPSQVKQALDKLISSAASGGADMVLSYPIEGLLKDSRQVLPELFQKHYGAEPEIIEIVHSHSSMGASKGAAAANPVVEMIYRARA